MGYTLKTNIADKKNYGGIRSTASIEYIVIHYTANDGDTDEANANYFKNNIVNASAHYFVDDDSVTQSVHDNYIAWHCGGNRYSNYKTTGGAKYYNKCTNINSIGIELCDTVRNGRYGFTDKTLKNAIELVKDKMKQYNVSIDRVIRHFDVTGKVCPKPFVDDEKAWKEFKSMLVTPTATTESTATQNDAVSDKNVNVYYKVKTQKHGWLGEVKNLTDYAGWQDSPITDVAIKVDKGNIKYRVHVKGGNWLSWVNGYDVKNHINGYAGNGKPIDAIQIYYSTPNDIRPFKKAKYKVNNYGWQYDTETKNNQDGYAGLFGKNVTKLQIEIE